MERSTNFSFAFIEDQFQIQVNVALASLLVLLVLIPKDELRDTLFVKKLGPTDRLVCLEVFLAQNCDVHPIGKYSSLNTVK